MTESRRVPIAILLSGRGTNMVSLVRAAQEGGLHADVRVVVSNKADAGGLLLAAGLGVPTAVLSHKDFQTREAFDSALADLLAPRVARLAEAEGLVHHAQSALRRTFHPHP